MRDPAPDPSTGDDVTSGGSGLAPPTGMPRWVKVFLIVAVILVVALVVSFLAGVQHGPRLH